MGNSNDSNTNNRQAQNNQNSSRSNGNEPNRSIRVTPEIAEQIARRLAGRTSQTQSQRRQRTRVRTSNSGQGGANGQTSNFSNFGDMILGQIEEAQLQYALERSRVETEQEPKGAPPCDESVLLELVETCLEMSDLSDGNEQCVVCFEAQQAGDLAVILPCGHAFHKNCVFNWLKRHNTCPVCRMEMNSHFEEQSNVVTFKQRMNDRKLQHTLKIEAQKRKLEDLNVENSCNVLEELSALKVNEWNIPQLKSFLEVFSPKELSSIKEKSGLVDQVKLCVRKEYLSKLTVEELAKEAVFLNLVKESEDKCSREELVERIFESCKNILN